MQVNRIYMEIIHNCSDEFRKINLKSTPVRISIMQLLEKTKRPIDALMILEYLKNKNIAADPATVFRILNVLTDKQLVRKIQFFEGKNRYEASSKGDHHHLVCLECNKIEDVEDKFMMNWENEIKNKKGFLVRNHNLEFFGFCPNCQK